MMDSFSNFRCHFIVKQTRAKIFYERFKRVILSFAFLNELKGEMMKN